MKIILMWLSLGATFFPSPQQRPIPADAAIVLAIRIFDGTAEVTAETRVHVYPAGTRGEPLAADFLEGLGHQIPVTPGATSHSNTLSRAVQGFSDIAPLEQPPARRLCSEQVMSFTASSDPT